MKRALVTCLLIMAMVTLLCVPAFAANGTITLTVEKDYIKSISINGQDAEDGKYEITEGTKFNLKYEKGGTLNQTTYYMIYVLNKEWVGTEPLDQAGKKIPYTDQVTLDNGVQDVPVFNVSFPEPTTAQDYYVYITGGDIKTPLLVATTTYKPGYVLGNVNMDVNNEIDAKDALACLQIYVGKDPYKNPTEAELGAGDVNLDGEVDAKDALAILQYYVGKIKSFEEVQAKS